MREYSVQELSTPATYDQDAELLALARRIAVSRWTVDSGVSLAAWKRAHVHGEHPDAVKCAVDALVDHERRAQALARSVHGPLFGFAPPEGWTVRGDSEWLHLTGQATPSLSAALRRIGGELMASSSCWRVPVERASSLHQVFARAAWRAARAPQRGSTSQGIDYWLKRLESKADQGWVYKNALTALTQLGVNDYPDLQVRMDAILLKAAAVAALPPAASSADRIASAPSTRLPRRLLPLNSAPSLGRPERFGQAIVVFTSATRPFLIRPEHPSIYGSHLRGHEGEQGAYFYYRSPTQDEAAGLSAPLQVPTSESIA